MSRGQAPGGEEQSATVVPTATPPTINADATDADYGVGVLVVQDGRFLCGTRLKGGSVGGPGGHIEAGESPEDAAIRETREEFGITPKDLMPVAFLSDLKPPYCPSHVFLCTDFDGSIRCADGEMTSPGFITAEKGGRAVHSESGTSVPAVCPEHHRAARRFIVKSRFDIGCTKC